MGCTDSRSLVRLNFTLVLLTIAKALYKRSSFAHGAPTLISKNQYDVPVPNVAALVTPKKDSAQRIESAQCFVALCTLTEILGEILPLVYDRRQRASAEVSRLLRRLETDLDNWEDTEPAISVLRDGNDAYNQSFGGSSSLRLGFLATKMLICRISFRVSIPSWHCNQISHQHVILPSRQLQDQ